MCWPRCTLCGCVALKSAHLTSPQTVSATVQNNKPKSELFLFFSTADAARPVGLEPGRDVGQVVALAEQNAIDLISAQCLAAHLCKQTIRGIAAEGQTARRYDCMSVDERVILLESGFGAGTRGRNSPCVCEVPRETRVMVWKICFESSTISLTSSLRTE